MNDALGLVPADGVATFVGTAGGFHAECSPPAHRGRSESEAAPSFGNADCPGGGLELDSPAGALSPLTLAGGDDN